MNPERKYGEAEVVKAVPLPELSFDMLTNYPHPEKLGDTHTPITYLPPFEFDMVEALSAPRLELVVEFQPAATPNEVARDLRHIYATVNRLECNYGGTGMVPLEETDDATNAIRLTFRPSNPTNALERLNKILLALDEPRREMGEVPSIKHYLARIQSLAA